MGPPKLNFCFSAGFRMRKEHIKLSSTDMTCTHAPRRGKWGGRRAGGGARDAEGEHEV